MKPAIHFIRVDLGETTTSESFLFWVHRAVMQHSWACDYCIARGLL